MAWRAAVSRNMRSLMVHCCPKSESSAATRAFVNNNYSEIMHLNPRFDLLVREGAGVEPKFIARYDGGVEEIVSLANLSEDGIVQRLETLVVKGAGVPRTDESIVERPPAII